MALSLRQMRLLILDGVNSTLHHHQFWCLMQFTSKEWHISSFRVPELAKDFSGVGQGVCGGIFVGFFKHIRSSGESYSHGWCEKALWVARHLFQNLTLTSFGKCEWSFQASKAFWRFYLRCLLYNSMTHKTYCYLWSHGIASTESLLNQSRVPFPISSPNHGSLSIVQNAIY